MAVWSKDNLYDRGVDRWKEKDNDYAKVNKNREIMTYYFRSDEIVDTDAKGNLVGEGIYNGSPSWYSRSMATAFQGSLLSKNLPWIRYRMDQLQLKGVDLIDIWLQEVQEYMSDAYQRSNFYDVQPQFTHDGVTTGSPVLFGEENIAERRTMWMPQHFKTVRVFYDKFNNPEGVIVQEKTWTAKQIFDKFIGKDDEQYTKSKEKLSSAVYNSLIQGHLGEKYVVYRYTFKETDPIWDGTGEGAFKKPSGEWTWLTAYFLELTEAEGDKKNKPLNDNMGDFTQPFTVWNFDKKPWECSSRTPAWYAIWDNLSLQQIEKNYLEDIQASNRPAMIAPDTMANRLQLGPEGIMLVTEDEYMHPPKPIDRVGGLEFSRDLIEIKEDALKRWFFINELQMFSNLAFDKNQPVTATQIWQMAGEKATMLSPAIETHCRHLEAADARMIDIEVRAGRGPFSPQRMENISDVIASNIEEPISSVSISPVFIGQLAQAQKASQQIQPIQSTMEAVGPLMEAEPNLRFRYRWAQMAGKIEDALDFPQDVVVPDDEYQAAIEAQNAALAEQRQQQMAIETMKASKNLQGPVDETSVLAKAGEEIG